MKQREYMWGVQVNYLRGGWRWLPRLSEDTRRAAREKAKCVPIGKTRVVKIPLPQGKDGARS